MRGMFKKGIASVLTVALAGSMLAGCGASTATSDAASGASDASAVAGGKTKIEFFNQKPEIVSILKKLIAEYEKENPNVSIQLTTPANPATVLASRMSSNNTPDVFTAWPNSPFFLQVDSGYVMDLAHTGIMDNVQDVARNQWKHNNGEYAATMSYNCSGIWYNKELFEKAGISETPKTWSTLLEDCKKLKAAGITPFVISSKETEIADRLLQVFLASSMGNTYDMFEKDAAAKTVDEKKAYGKVLNRMAGKILQVAQYGQSDPNGTDQDSATANFANGKGAMMIGGSWLLASITAANPKIQISMMPIPGDTEAETNTCAYPGDMALSIAKNTKVKDAAVQFVKWMTSTKIASEYAKQEGNPSCIKGVDYVAPQFADLYKHYVTTNQFILNPDCNWSSAQQQAAGVAVQQLYYNKNAESFASELASAFNDN